MPGGVTGKARKGIPMSIAETSPGIVAGIGIAHLADEDVQVTVVR